ncbi:MAG: hypothetical protein WCD89_14335 [Anaerocolumna sp.]
MKIKIKNYFLYSVAYDDQKKAICKIKNHILSKGQKYIYDSNNRLRYITNIENDEIGEKYMDYHKYQIIQTLSDSKKIVGTANLDYIDKNDGTGLKRMLLRPPLINKLIVYLSNDRKISIYLNRDGSCILKNEQNEAIGKISGGMLKGYLLEFHETDDVCLICAIFVLTRYLDEENNFYIV